MIRFRRQERKPTYTDGIDVDLTRGKIRFYLSPETPEFLEQQYHWLMASSLPDADLQTDAVIRTITEIGDSYREAGHHYKADDYENTKRMLLGLPPLPKPRLFSGKWWEKRRYIRNARKPEKYVCPR